MSEIGWANMWFKEERMDVMDFTDYYATEWSCILMPKPKPYLGIYSLVLPLKRETWLGLAIALLGLVAFYMAHSLAWPGPTLADLLLYCVAVVLEKSSALTHHAMSTRGLRYGYQRFE